MVSTFRFGSTFVHHLTESNFFHAFPRRIIQLYTWDSTTGKFYLVAWRLVQTRDYPLNVGELAGRVGPADSGKAGVTDLSYLHIGVHGGGRGGHGARRAAGSGEAHANSRAADFRQRPGARVSGLPRWEGGAGLGFVLFVCGVCAVRVRCVVLDPLPMPRWSTRHVVRMMSLCMVRVRGGPSLLSSHILITNRFGQVDRRCHRPHTSHALTTRRNPTGDRRSASRENGNTFSRYVHNLFRKHTPFTVHRYMTRELVTFFWRAPNFCKVLS
jgi:hypothetical protein